MTERIIGIDLGTSNTVVAYVDELQRPRVAADSDGQTLHPSVVSFHPNGGVVVGVQGKLRKVLDPRNTIYSAKRMIGQPFSAHAVQVTAGRVPFAIKQGPNDQALVVTRAGEFAVPEISAIVLDHARKIACAAMQAEVARAVVTVPASFTDVQRSSTATAGALAGLAVVRVLNEPTAAALAYGSSKRLDEIIAVYDWGGGTFDITILKLEDQVYTVLGTSGDAFLGGEDMDERLVEQMAAGFLSQHRVDLRADELAMMRLRAIAEHTKIELSQHSRALVKIEEIAFGPNGKPIDLETTLTRDKFVGSIGDLIERTFTSCKEAMVLAGVGVDRIADIVLVGGTSRIPSVQQQVARFFGREPRVDVNPEAAIAIGAALQAASIETMLSRTPTRPLASRSVPIPVDDLDPAAESPRAGIAAGAPAEVEPEPAPSRIAEVKRPKRGTDMFSGKQSPPGPPPPRGRPVDPKQPAEQAKEVFGDLFGDKPAKTTQPLARIALPPRPAKPPPIIETRRPLPAKQRAADVTPPAPTPKPSAPVVDQGWEVDDLDEKSGELTIDVGQGPARSRRDSGSQITIEIDSPETPSDSPFGAEIDLPSMPARGRELSGSIDLGSLDASGVVEFVAPDPRAEASGPIELVMPSPRKSRAAGLDYQPPIDVAVPAVRGGATVVDVTPRSLGIGTVAGFCEELIRRNSQVPIAVRKLFSTGRDFQDSVHILICQGESRRIEGNLLIGDLVLEHLPRRPRGETQIDVEFRLDASGILHVTARDVASGTEHRVRLDLVGGMAPETLSAAANRLKQLSNIPMPD